MKITQNDLILNFSHLTSEKVLEDWCWLVGADKTIVLVSSIGDLFLSDKYNHYFWLNVGEGILEKVADSKAEFNQLLQDKSTITNWFMIDLIADLKQKERHLQEKQVYSYIKHPLLGGKYQPSNFELTDMEVHFSIYGQLLQKIKNLPNGTSIGTVSFK